jgi:hypothetical protein
MKIIISLISLSLSCITIGCNTQKNSATSNEIVQSKPTNSKIEKISYVEYTRGTRRIFTFTESTKTVAVNDQNVTNYQNTSSEWTALREQVLKLDLPKINTYKAPTSDRFSDAAYAATINISYDGKQFSSSDFDSGFPPKELEQLYNELTKQTRLVKKGTKGNR